MNRTARRWPCILFAAIRKAGAPTARRSVGGRICAPLFAALMVATVMSSAIAIPAAHASVQHPASGANGAHAQVLAQVPPPPDPPGGKVYGGYDTEDECNLQKALAYIPPGWQATCFYWDDGKWYLAIWPMSNNETWFNTNSEMPMEVYHSSLSNGATVDQWTYNGSATQWWMRLPLGNGWYRLINSNSGLCLGVSGGSISQKAALVQWTCNDNADQNWHWTFTGIYHAGWPVYNLVNEKSGMCADVPYASKTAGTALWQYSCIGSVAQQWY